MIISASRRTDIPAFYSEWLIRRLNEGYVDVRNPYNFHQISRLDLTPQTIDCLVFWTKDARPMLKKLARIDDMGYPYYFLWTLTAYGREVENFVPNKNAIIDGFQRLSEKIGSERVIWRYDPILFNEKLTMDYHCSAFETLCRCLAGYTKRCIISFFDPYPKVRRRMAGFVLGKPEVATQEKLVQRFVEIAKNYEIVPEMCCEILDFSRFGMKRSACINQGMIEKVVGCPICPPQAAGQRQLCNCLDSVDIGVYDSCLHGCLYCYATSEQVKALKNYELHDPASPLLIGHLGSDDHIMVRKMRLFRESQLHLF